MLLTRVVSSVMQALVRGRAGREALRRYAVAYADVTRRLVAWFCFVLQAFGMSMCVWDVCAARARAYAVTCVNPGRAGREAPRPPRSGGLR